MSAVKYPLSTEKSIKMMEQENKLVFVVEKKATKQEIKADIEKTFNVKVKRVNTQITNQGIKKAYVEFAEETPAMDIATQLGLMWL